jgi:hypothetical protein
MTKSIGVERMKRDLKADLKLCNKATPGRWVICDWDTDVCGGIIAPDIQEVVIEAEDWDMPVKVKREDAEFMCQAREGWPHAIERAIKAEALAKRLVEALEKFIVNVAWELTEQEHLLNLAKEVLEDD